MDMPGTRLWYPPGDGFRQGKFWGSWGSDLATWRLSCSLSLLVERSLGLGDKPRVAGSCSPELIDDCSLGEKLNEGGLAGGSGKNVMSTGIS